MKLDSLYFVYKPQKGGIRWQNRERVEQERERQVCQKARGTEVLRELHEIQCVDPRLLEEMRRHTRNEWLLCKNIATWHEFLFYAMSQ